MMAGRNPARGVSRGGPAAQAKSLWARLCQGSSSGPWSRARAASTVGPSLS